MNRIVFIDAVVVIRLLQVVGMDAKDGALAVAFGGGFTLFYMGAYLITDMIAGYLVGAGAGCCAIGFLLRNERRKEEGQLGELVPAGWKRCTCQRKVTMVHFSQNMTYRK